MNTEKFATNQASVIGTKNDPCSNCAEPFFFALRDNYHEFSVSLSTLLECLKFAENEGVIPPIPSHWWGNVAESFNLPSNQI